MIRAFLSFVEEDLQYVNLFRGQAKSDASDLEFEDYSVKEPYNSTNTAYIKSRISERIARSQILMCLYGTKTYGSPWVDWEIKEALAMGKPVMGVQLYPVFYAPPALANHPRVDWNIKQIVMTMRVLTGVYR